MSHCQQAHSLTGCWPTYPRRNQVVVVVVFGVELVAIDGMQLNLPLDHRLLYTCYLYCLIQVGTSFYEIKTMNRKSIDLKNQKPKHRNDQKYFMKYYISLYSLIK